MGKGAAGTGGRRRHRAPRGLGGAQRGWGGVWGPHPQGLECQAKALRPLPAGAGEPRVVRGQAGPQAWRGGWRRLERPEADMWSPPLPPPWQLPASLSGQLGMQSQGPPSAPTGQREKQSRGEAELQTPCALREALAGWLSPQGAGPVPLTSQATRGTSAPLTRLLELSLWPRGQALSSNNRGAAGPTARFGHAWTWNDEPVTVT